MIDIEKGQTSAKLLYFLKAFDGLDHSILLFKLNDIGLITAFLYFSASYLEDIRYKIEVGSQGSVLGPLLSIIVKNPIILNLQ